MSILDTKSKQPCVAVCVTPQESCARLIEAGARIAKQEGLPLAVLSVFKESNGLNANEGGALETLFECAGRFNASMNVYFNNSPALVTAVASKKLGVVNLITGFPEEGGSGFVSRVHELLPELIITMVDKDMNEYKILPTEIEQQRLISIH
jgi:K+-sensing histidine kinase KdpD